MSPARDRLDEPCGPAAWFWQHGGPRCIALGVRGGRADRMGSGRMGEKEVEKMNIGNASMNLAGNGSREPGMG